ncbi:MAG: ParA family protein [Archaeoglobaceae archaeon]
MPVPKVITITNQKGGTGKTTLTALLSYGLASKGYNVLMLDLDPQAHLSSLFLKQNDIEKVNHGTFEMARDEKFNIKKIELNVEGKIGLVPSGLNYILDVYRGRIPAWDQYAIKRRISREPAITGHYDFVVCDTPPELFPPTLWGLYAADYIIIPSNMEELSLLGVKLLLKEVLPDVMLYEHNLKVLGIVMVRVDRRIKQERFEKVKNDIIKILRGLPSSITRNVYRKPLFDTIIHKHSELTDLVYRPRRWEVPLDRTLRSNDALKQDAEAFTNEVLTRMNDFRSVE